MITRVEIRNYRGIEALEVEPGPGGAVARGRCSSGKTSLLKAVRAALDARDISPDAIRHGADKAEILVDLDNVSVKRSITPKGSTLAVTKDGFKAPKPQAYLAELLGTSAIDPMDLLLMKPADRKKKILEALPVTVTVEQLRKWWPRCPDDFDVSGHGLEVVEGIRAKAYERRTAANKIAKAAAGDLEVAANAARKTKALVPDCMVDADQARGRHSEAVAELARVRARHEDSKRSRARAAATEGRIARLLEDAAAIRGAIPRVVLPDELESLRNDVYTCKARCEDLFAKLEAAKEDLESAKRDLSACEVQNHNADTMTKNAAALEAQAAELQAMVSDLGEDVGQDVIDAAAKAEAMAFEIMNESIDAARLREEAERQNAVLEKAKAKAAELEAEAARLDTMVRALTHDAPRELLAACDGIPGLMLEGDEVRLDGVSLDGLCGKEQIRFAVQVAKRANAKTKLLIVDGLERLDPDSYSAFVEEATADGWQLLASRVDAGDIVIEAIGAEVSE